MGIFARLLNAVPKSERDGIRLHETEPWKVSPTTDVGRFVRALAPLVPEGSIAYFEGTGEPHVAEYLRGVSIPAPVRVAIGTIWPRPDCYHVPLTVKTMDDLAAFLERRPAGYFCSHCHVYRDGSVLLQWYDAFTNDDAMYISRAIAGEVVDRFAVALGSGCTVGWLARTPQRPTTGAGPHGQR
jgi:hypothetical protein